MTEHNKSEHVALLTSAPNEMEAGIIVGALEERGIKATMTGTFTSGFRAEAPGWVQVLVADDDLAAAQEVLDEVRSGDDKVDWSQVDVGEPEDE
jgi:Putative prokaryotic signal transducing protein